MLILPKINLLSAQTSSSLFLSELTTQWYSGCFSFIVQFFVLATAASLLQFLLRAAMSHSSLDFGQDVTTLTSLTVAWQPSLTLHDNCCKKFKTNILILVFSINNNYKFHYIVFTTTKYKSIQITLNWIISIASVVDNWNQVTMLQL